MGDEDLMDYNRQNDGLILKEAPNLPVPAMTYDIYNVTGPGYDHDVSPGLK